MPDLLVDLETSRSSGPLYQRIADSIRAGILAGRLQQGERVPATRALASEIKVNRNTVAQAYDQLTAEGFLEARHGSGTFVAREIPQARFSARRVRRGQQRLKRVAFANSPTPPAFYNRVLTAEEPPELPGVDIDMRLGAPDLGAFPLRQWRRVVSNQLLVPRRDRMNYGSAWGLKALRVQVAAYLGRARGIDCDYRNVLITGGSQQSLWLAASLLVGRGDEVMVEDPGYLGARAIFSALGARQVGVPVDGDGADAGAVARIVGGRPRPKLLHLTPSHQYPTGVTLGAARRMELLELAGRHGFMIVEDDYDSEYRYEGRPVRALAGIDRAGVVIYVGSFSKVMYPSLRVGYVVAPEWLIESMVGLRWHIDFMPPMLESAALAEFIEAGHFERHLRRMRALYAEKRQAFVEIFSEAMPDVLPDPLPPGGMKLMLNVPAHLSCKEAHELALKAGVGVYDQSVTYFEPEKAPKTLTIGFTALPIDRVREAARRLTQAWR